VDLVWSVRMGPGSRLTDPTARRRGRSFLLFFFFFLAVRGLWSTWLRIGLVFAAVHAQIQLEKRIRRKGEKKNNVLILCC
jgi:hypothetical protein